MNFYLNRKERGPECWHLNKFIKMQRRPDSFPHLNLHSDENHQHELRDEMKK